MRSANKKSVYSPIIIFLIFKFVMKHLTALSCALVLLTFVSFIGSAYAKDEFLSISVLPTNGVTDMEKLKSDQAACQQDVEKSGAKSIVRRQYIYRQCLLEKGYRLSN